MVYSFEQTLELSRLLLRAETTIEKIEIISQFFVKNGDAEEMKYIMGLFFDLKTDTKSEKTSNNKQREGYKHPKFLSHELKKKCFCDTCKAEITSNEHFLHRIGPEAVLNYHPFEECFPEEHCEWMKQDKDYINFKLPKRSKKQNGLQKGKRGNQKNSDCSRQDNL